MNLTILPYLISLALGAGGGFGVAWKIQAANITQLELTHANARIATQREARVAIERSLQKLSTAQVQAEARAAKLAAELDRNRGDLARLRSASTTAVRTATDSPTTCIDTATTLSELFNQCSDRLVELANKADRHVSDIKMIISARE